MYPSRFPFVSFPHCSGRHVSTLPQAFQATAAMRPDAVALRGLDPARSYTWAQYRAAVRAVAGGLAALRVARGETIALLLANRPEFHLVDTAALHLGAVPFSLYNTAAPEQIAEVCGNAGNRVVITERALLPRLTRTGLHFAAVVCVDEPGPGAISLAQLIENADPDFDFETRWQQVRPDDLATLTYTAGTTGSPKGVELTHSNILAQLVALGEHLPADFDDRIVSYLPAAHIADRITAHYAGMTRGIQVTSLADAARMGEVLTEVRPTVLFGVPRVWQKARAGIESAIEAEPRRAKRAVAGWAVRTGSAHARVELAGGRPGPVLRLRQRIADRLVLRRIRAGIGLDHIRFAASGAAPIPAEVLAYFHGLGIRLTEVWGLSEAAGVTTTTTAGNPGLGTVGAPLRGAEVRLAADGELLVRGPMVMRGYHRDPDRTRRAFYRGDWLRTGDLGERDEAGNYRIVGRRGDMIINDSGKNIAPSRIENAVRAASFLVGNVVVFGEQRPFLTALITLDTTAIAADAASNGVVAADVAILAGRPAVRQRITEAVREGNARVSRPEQIKRFVLLDHVWEPGSPELTPKLTVRRDVVAKRYAELLETLYSEAPDRHLVTELPAPAEPRPRRSGIRRLPRSA
ncbi:AMP-dependent synthetase/ligase [Nocardia jiangsuensis]|uniref:Acyl-CoA synthetase n=1 Tax=Nocardia jiangsuensis TaxID=1691563 RepID=A0ABV8DZV1_9NOCA